MKGPDGHPHRWDEKPLDTSVPGSRDPGRFGPCNPYRCAESLVREALETHDRGGNQTLAEAIVETDEVVEEFMVGLLMNIQDVSMAIRAFRALEIKVDVEGRREKQRREHEEEFERGMADTEECEGAFRQPATLPGSAEVPLHENFTEQEIWFAKQRQHKNDMLGLEQLRAPAQSQRHMDGFMMWLEVLITQVMTDRDPRESGGVCIVDGKRVYIAKHKGRRRARASTMRLRESAFWRHRLVHKYGYGFCS